MRMGELMLQVSRQREIRAEHNINILRAFGVIVVAVVGATLMNIHGLFGAKSAVWFGTGTLVFLAYVYLVHRLTSAERYRAWLKYVTVTVDYGLAYLFFVASITMEPGTVLSTEANQGYSVGWLILINLLNAFRHGRAIVIYGTIVGMLTAVAICLPGVVSPGKVLYPVFLVGMSGLLVGLMSTGVSRLFLNLRRKEQLMRYLSGPLVESIEAGEVSLSLGGVKREVTVLLTDIRGFTTLAESRDPQEVVTILNEYFSEMTKAVFEHGGVVDKYIGDAILAVFGTPHSHSDDAHRALLAAEQMQRYVEELNSRWATQGKPTLSIGSALHTGPVVVGNIGSPKRMEYTVIGDAVNLTSRIEGLNKRFDTRLLMTESTFNKVKDQVNCRPLGESKIRGRQETVCLFTTTN